MKVIRWLMNYLQSVLNISINKKLCYLRKYYGKNSQYWCFSFSVALRHSEDDGTIKNSTPCKGGVLKEYDSKPKNKKHVSSASAVSDYGVGPPQKAVESNGTTVCNEEYNETPVIRTTPICKVSKTDAEKIIKASSGNKFNVLQNAYEPNSINAPTCVRVNSKSSRSARTVHLGAAKPSRTIHLNKAVPIKSGFRLQLISTSNCIVFKRNSKCVLNATSELKVRHRRKHRRRSHKKAMKAKSSRKMVPILPKIPLTTAPIIAPCPSVAPSPYVALTPLKAVYRNNTIDGVPCQLKTNHSNPACLKGPNRIGIIQMKPSEPPVMEVLNIDTSQNNIHPEARCNSMVCKQLILSKNPPEVRVSHIHGNSVAVLPVMPSARVPDVPWAPVHPRPLGMCTLQARKVGGLVSSDRDLNNVWLSMKSTIVEPDAYKTTVLCSASSSQSDYHLNHSSSINTILANITSNNCSRNSLCKISNSNLRLFPHIMNNEKAGLSGIIDTSSSVMMLGSNNSKMLSNSDTFLHTVKTTSVIKHDPPNPITQPYPGIFLQNQNFLLPRNFKVSLKKRKQIPIVSSAAKKLKEKESDEATETGCRNTQNEACFQKSVSILRFSLPNGISKPVNSYTEFYTDGQVVPQSEIALNVVKSIDIFPSIGDTLCEANGRLSDLDQLKNDFMSGFHNMKMAPHLPDNSIKSICRKASATSIPNVRIASVPGTVQVNAPQIAYLTAAPVTFQLRPQMLGEIQLQSKANQTASSFPLKLISPAQSVTLTTARAALLQPEKDES
ncbi:hypothetical protein J437_LFUL005755 [Ladona fulva]|uniref:Uncharacterized protein n=1 Tax=Ladona fulva TaxID=123851 RepID=A0A8K0NYZ5_LADFU|nr:hypothetical protein J437_LFUL005755 [Ladona fulva]